MRSYAGLILVAFGLAMTAPAQAACDVGPESAAANRASIASLAWAPFRRAETGWYVYAPRIAHEIRSSCAFGSRGFAAALARWQAARQLPSHGRVDVLTMSAMIGGWHAQRPYVRLRASGSCPAAPELSALAPATISEGYGGKLVLLRPAALASYRQMRAAARRDVPALASDKRWLSIFSAFRAPVDDAARCAIDQNCQGVVRADCSVHRTGLAIDLYVGETRGLPPESSADSNRIAMSRTPAYRWLVQNAARFGFVNYAFEPWHWEWTGEAPLPDSDPNPGEILPDAE
jgi:D-alanyl-D-alanine carboxypeptidase